MILDIDYKGERRSLPITPAVEVAFERNFKGGFGKLLRDEERVEYIYWLAWETLRRNAIVVPPFGDEFFNDLVSVDIESDPNG